MEDFEFYQTIRLSSKKEELSKAFLKLRKVYKIIPETVGCLESIRAKKGCCSWCCRIQTPQLFYSEFLLIWEKISKEFNNDQIIDLFEKCMLNAVNTSQSKGCVFFDEKNGLCKVHDERPYNCRLYGITPEEEFRPRYERLKQIYKDAGYGVIKDQCNLIKTVDGTVVNVIMTNKWFSSIQKVDTFIGIPKQLATDEMGGSYRSSHDHVLLYNMPENVLNSLAGIKLYEHFHEKIEAVQQIILCMKDFFKKNEK